MLPQEAKDKHHLTQAQKEKAVFTDFPLPPPPFSDLDFN